MHTVESFYVLSKKHVNIQQVSDDLLSTWQQGHQSQDIIGAGRGEGGADHLRPKNKGGGAE